MYRRFLKTEHGPNLMLTTALSRRPFTEDNNVACLLQKTRYSLQLKQVLLKKTIELFNFSPRRSLDSGRVAIWCFKGNPITAKSMVVWKDEIVMWRISLPATWRTKTPRSGGRLLGNLFYFHLSLPHSTPPLTKMDVKLVNSIELVFVNNLISEYKMDSIALNHN